MSIQIGRRPVDTNAIYWAFLLAKSRMSIGKTADTQQGMLLIYSNMPFENVFNIKSGIANLPRELHSKRYGEELICGFISQNEVFKHFMLIKT